MGLYLVTKDMPGYRSGRHTISPDAGHKHRHLYSCRASPSGALCSISVHKGACPNPFLILSLSVLKH